MKRMFDKEEIVEIAKEEGGSVTVDSELSPTSENPVQNKVIYEALEDSQVKYYEHNIYATGTRDTGKFVASIKFINKKAEAYTYPQLCQYLNSSSLNGKQNALSCSGIFLNNNTLDGFLLRVFSQNPMFLYFTIISTTGTESSASIASVGEFYDTVVER